MAKRYAKKDKYGRYINPATGKSAPGAKRISFKPITSSQQDVSPPKPKPRAAMGGAQPTSQLSPGVLKGASTLTGPRGQLDKAFPGIEKAAFLPPPFSAIGLGARAIRDPGQFAGEAATAISILFGGMLWKAATKTTAVAKAGQVGTIGAVDIMGASFTKTGRTAASIAVNTATKAKTTAWLTRAAQGLSNPAIIATTMIAAIGSYPFAGFIKEEALQTLSFGLKTAISNDDEEGQAAAIAFEEELLNPTFIDTIKNGVPFANVLFNLDDFFEAAKIKLAIDKQLIIDKKIQRETNETETKTWQRNSKEEAQQVIDNIDYYNTERAKMVIWEQEAKAAARAATRVEEIKARNEDAAYWAAQRARQRELEEKDREAIAEFWRAYRKEAQKAREAERPSSLNFGLI